MSARETQGRPGMNSTTRSSDPKPAAKRRSRRRARIRAGAAGHGRLASPRDRERLRERHASERSRVEEMLASAPLPADRRRARWAAPSALPVAPASPPASSSAARPIGPRARRRPKGGASPALPTGCPVCASTTVTIDEVGSSGRPLRLSECLHCEHRWTARPPRRFAEIGGVMGRRAASARAVAP